MSVSLHQLETLFTAAATLPAEARAEFLERSCGGDAALRARVEGMLRTNDSLGGFLEATVAPGFAEAAPGARIGRYTLREKLGEGGVGVVFLAEQAEPVRRQVALKVIKPGMDSREVIARFESERQALALMDHPHIARVFDAGATPAGRPYFVMELVSGPPITEFCDAQRLTLETRLGLFVKVCRALQHAHAKGIIHRDIKPSNILIASHDGEHLPKVIDFGIAKATEFKLTEKTLLTVFPRVMGTPGYMSPEQAAEEGGTIDARSDVYALGVLVCELAVGRTPLGPLASGAGFAAIRRRICEEGPRGPADLIEELDAAALARVADSRQTNPDALHAAIAGPLHWIALRCLAKDPASRYASARDLAEDVQRFVRHEPVEAKPPAMLDTLKNQLRTHGAARWLGAAAAAATEGFAQRRAATGGASAPAAAPRTINVAAHHHVLEGRRHWNEFTEEGFVRAEAAFARALEISPGYTMALAGLAYVAGRRAILATVASRHIEGTLATAERMARETLAQDPNVADAHAVLGAMAILRGQVPEAVRHLEQALGVNPNLELAWIYLSRAHMRRGRPDLALPALENARLLVPVRGAFALHRGTAFLLARRHGDALAVFDEAEREGDASIHTRALSALALFGLERKDEALARARGALDPALQSEWTVGMRAWAEGLAAWALAEGGARAEAEKIVGAILTLPERHHFAAALGLAALGDPGRAIELLADTPQWLVDYVFLFEQETGRLRGHPGFEPFLRLLHAAEAWQSLVESAGPKAR